MRKLVGLLLGLPVMLIAASFAGTNLQPVSMGLFPLPWRYDVPLALVVYGSLVLGFVIGAAAAWLGGGSTRRGLRQAAQDMIAKDRDIARLKEEAAKAAAKAAEAAKGGDLPVAASSRIPQTTGSVTGGGEIERP